jgi:hypothetical protein
MYVLCYVCVYVCMYVCADLLDESDDELSSEDEDRFALLGMARATGLALLRGSTLSPSCSTAVRTLEHMQRH